MTIVGFFVNRGAPHCCLPLLLQLRMSQSNKYDWVSDCRDHVVCSFSGFRLTTATSSAAAQSSPALTCSATRLPDGSFVSAAQFDPVWHLLGGPDRKSYTLMSCSGVWTEKWQQVNRAWASVPCVTQGCRSLLRPANTLHSSSHVDSTERANHKKKTAITTRTRWLEVKVKVPLNAHNLPTILCLLTFYLVTGKETVNMNVTICVLKEPLKHIFKPNPHWYLV